MGGSEPTYSRVGPQFDEEPLALEAQLADFGPVEGVDLSVALKNHCQYEGVFHCQCVPFIASCFDLDDFL